jgi:hypothetical protein
MGEKGRKRQLPRYRMKEMLLCFVCISKFRDVPGFEDDEESGLRSSSLTSKTNEQNRHNLLFYLYFLALFVDGTNAWIHIVDNICIALFKM